MRFADIVGNQQAVEALRRMVDSNRVPHAIMLSGPQGIGKMKLARAFTQYLHCSNRHDGDSCGQCASCLQHQKFNNPDIHFEYPVTKINQKPISDDFALQWQQMLGEHEYMEWETWLDIIDADNKQPVIYVSQAADIAAKALMSPYQEKHKVFVIWLPEKMQTEAANKLLKLIEEPYEDTLFVLVSNDSREVLPTVFSRVQRINMRLIPENIIARQLMLSSIGENQASTMARLAEGSMGKALQIAGNHQETDEFGNLFREIMRCAYARKVARLRQISDDLTGLGREKARRFLQYCARMVRENFIYNLAMPQLSLQTPEEENFSYRFAPYIHEGNVEDMLREFTAAERDISRNANGKIVFFSLFLHLCLLIRTRQPNKSVIEFKTN